MCDACSPTHEQPGNICEFITYFTYPLIMVTTLAVPQTNEELNTFSNTLKALRETLSSLVTMPIDDFRSDDAHPTALCVAVMELAEIMKEYSSNECDWGDWFSETDILILLLRVESLARRDIEETPMIMQDVLMAVRGLMTRKMLENYRRIGGHPDGEEIILTLWQAMLVRQGW
jgi:citrate synthase